MFTCGKIYVSQVVGRVIISNTDDNALAHKSATVQEYLKKSGLDVLDHPPNNPDLSLCDF
jgi:hypothetical protein